MERISTGAEATVYRNGEYIVKIRDPKEYRIPEIDTSIRKTRTRLEMKIFQKLEALEIGPKLLPDEIVLKLLSESPDTLRPLSDYSIYMEYLPGNTLRKSILDKESDQSNQSDQSNLDMIKSTYSTIGVLHSNQIVHGDLTPNNIILLEGKAKMIDFGLGKITSKPEDMAVDLYVFEKTISSMIDIAEDAIGEIITEYLSKNTRNGTDVISRLKEVRRRGRKRELSAVG